MECRLKQLDACQTVYTLMWRHVLWYLICWTVSPNTKVEFYLFKTYFSRWIFGRLFTVDLKYTYTVVSPVQGHYSSLHSETIDLPVLTVLWLNNKYALMNKCSWRILLMTPTLLIECIFIFLQCLLWLDEDFQNYNIWTFNCWLWQSHHSVVNYEQPTSNLVHKPLREHAYSNILKILQPKKGFFFV